MYWLLLLLLRAYHRFQWLISLSDHRVKYDKIHHLIWCDNKKLAWWIFTQMWFNAVHMYAILNELRSDSQRNLKKLKEERTHWKIVSKQTNRKLKQHLAVYHKRPSVHIALFIILLCLILNMNGKYLLTRCANACWLLCSYMNSYRVQKPGHRKYLWVFINRNSLSLSLSFFFPRSLSLRLCDNLKAIFQLLPPFPTWDSQ